MMAVAAVLTVLTTVLTAFGKSTHDVMCFVDVCLYIDVWLDAFVFYETKIDILPLSKTGLLCTSNPDRYHE